MGVHVEHQDGCAVVRMDSGKVNAMDLALCDELTQVFSGLPDDPSTGAVVLTGNARAFCAGVDLRAIVEGGPEHARQFVASLSDCFEAVLRCPLPVVAAVAGHAIAGGCVLACAADHRVVADDPGVQLGLTELAVGVPFPTVALEIMRWRLGDARLGQRVLGMDTVPGSQAQSAGLADETVPSEQVLPRALAVAQALARVPTATFRLTKAQLLADVLERVDARRDGWEPDVRDLWAGPDVRASMEQFVSRTLRR